jgi:hypothetical protein
MCRPDPYRDAVFRNLYDNLSEFSHPNTYALTMAHEMERIGFVRYNDLTTLRKKDIFFIYNLLISTQSFLWFYDEIFELLSKHEELPIIIRN